MSREGLYAAELVKVGSRIRERYLVKIPSDLSADPLLYELRGRLESDAARVSGYKEDPTATETILGSADPLSWPDWADRVVHRRVGRSNLRACLCPKADDHCRPQTIGADSPTIIRTYALQAMMLGLAGSLIGLAIGIITPARASMDDRRLDGLGSLGSTGIGRGA